MNVTTNVSDKYKKVQKQSYVCNFKIQRISIKIIINIPTLKIHHVIFK